MNMTSPLRAVIIDDEWLVRSELKILLEKYPEIKVIGEASDVQQAAQLIDTLNPDVIFLDIQMPGKTGFDLLEEKDIQSRVIFVTAYDQYAIRAFEVNALDYLLKPVRKERLAKTIERLLLNEQSGKQHKSKVSYDDVIYVMINGSFKFIKLPLLKCITAEGNYSFIYYKQNKRELVSKTLKEWENLLPDNYFVRIHRSTIINFEHVENIKKCKNYTHQVFVSDIEKPFIMSRRYTARLKHKLNW